MDWNVTVKCTDGGVLEGWTTGHDAGCDCDECQWWARYTEENQERLMAFWEAALTE